MSYQIDQSNKIENTAKTTYLSLTNGKTLITSISAKEKQVLKLYFRKLNKPLIFRLFTFSVLCSKVIKEIGNESVTIDREYTGHEIDIKSFITQILTIWDHLQSNISFGEIGKGARAHVAAYKAAEKKEKGEVVTAKEVLILYNVIDKS